MDKHSLPCINSDQKVKENVFIKAEWSFSSLAFLCVLLALADYVAEQMWN